MVSKMKQKLMIRNDAHNTYLIKKTKSFSDCNINLRICRSLVIGEVLVQQCRLLICECLDLSSCSISSSCSCSSRRFSSASSQAISDSESVSGLCFLFLDLPKFDKAVRMVFKGIFSLGVSIFLDKTNPGELVVAE